MNIEFISVPTIESFGGAQVDKRSQWCIPANRQATANLESAWLVCADLFSAAVSSLPYLGTQYLDEELLFCLLGGFGVPFELALSASEIVSRLDPFDHHWHEDELATRLSSELSQRQFLPKRNDGQLRRYRFPNRKVQLIVEARRWILGHGNLTKTLQGIYGEKERRRLLCDCPGVGPKTASWLLRNVGLASELAILDVHILRAMQRAGRISVERLPRDYERIEELFLSWCRELAAPPAAFDLFVWEWQRGSLVSK